MAILLWNDIAIQLSGYVSLIQLYSNDQIFKQTTSQSRNEHNCNAVISQFITEFSVYKCDGISDHSRMGYKTLDSNN